MATKKYLDYEGVKYLWSKINDKTDSLMYEIVYLTLTENQMGGGLYNCDCNS